jgi:hypothetical protein
MDRRQIRNLNLPLLLTCTIRSTLRIIELTFLAMHPQKLDGIVTLSLHVSHAFDVCRWDN